MNRRNFLYSFSAAAAILSGCEKGSDKSAKLDKKSTQTQEIAQETPKNIQSNKFEPFTQKLKIPKEIDFEHIAKAKFNAQKSLSALYKEKETDVLTFQGDLPNPTIRIKKGDDFELDFTNSLEKPTIIHWHGLLVPETMDGHPKDSI
ncbi:MAG TPA: multicopper oxidase domain-containing protein, partial [Sulfurimonas sp.]